MPDPFNPFAKTMSTAVRPQPRPAMKDLVQQQRIAPASAPASAQPALRSNDPAQRMRAELQNLGYSAPVIAGILANAQHESNFNPNVSGDNKTAHGYFQHRLDRVDNFIRETGMHPSKATPEAAARFVDWELRNPDKAGMTPDQAARIRSAGSASEAAMLFQEYYERPKVVDPARGQTALQYMNGVGPTFARKINEGVHGNLQAGVFDPSLYDPALASIAQAQQAALTPFSAEVDRAPRPEMPDAPVLAQKDFTKQDELLAGLAPMAFGEQEEATLKRTRLWQGAAQALASLSDDAGVGQILAKVGAGMLGGRLSANDEIQARADQYDEQMRQYQMLKLQYEDGKADEVLNAANAQAQLGYDHAMKSWADAAGQWQTDNTVSVQGGMLMTTTVGPDGNLVVSGKPIEALVAPAYAMQRAAVQTQIADGENRENVGNAALVNSAIVQAATAGAQADTEASIAQTSTDPSIGVGVGAATYAVSAVTNGLGPNIASQELWDQYQEEAKAELSQAGLNQASPDWTEQLEKRLATKLTLLLMSDENAAANMQQYSSILSGLDEARAKTTTRRKTGDTTTTTQLQR